MMMMILRRNLWTRLVSSRTCLANRLHFFSTYTLDEEATFGSYSVILPEEPFVWGVSHITPRTVPSSIQHPPYARTTLANAWPTSCSSRSGHPQQPYHDRVRLASEEETNLRASARLARKAREFAGTLVRVGKVLKAYMDGIMTPS